MHDSSSDFDLLITCFFGNIEEIKPLVKHYFWKTEYYLTFSELLYLLA